MSTRWQTRYASSLLRLLLRPFIGLNMEPIFYRGRGFHVVYFGLFAGLATFCGILTSAYYLHLKGIELQDRVWWLYVPIVCTLWLSARAGHLVALGRKFFENPKGFLSETTFYVQAAIFGLIPMAVVLALWNDIPVPLLLDSLAYGGLFALFVGRLGCYNYGCCFGLPTSAPWAVLYRNMQSKVLRLHPELKEVGLHPTQLYTALLNLFAFAVVTAWIPYTPRDGSLAIFFLFYHGITRFFMNRLRYVNLLEHRRGKRLPNIPLLTLFLGLLLLLVGPLFSPQFLGAHPVPLVAAPSIGGFFSWLAQDLSLLAAAAVSAALLFLGYGIHGETLGTFARARKGRG